MRHQNTHTSTFTLTSLQQKMIRELKRVVTIIQSTIALTNCSLRRMIGERIRDVLVIDSTINDLLVLLCNSLAKVWRE